MEFKVDGLELLDYLQEGLERGVLEYDLNDFLEERELFAWSLEQLLLQFGVVTVADN